MSKSVNLKQVQYHSLHGLIHSFGLEKQIKQHPPSSEPCGCNFHRRNFEFQPKTHSPECWWGDELTWVSFCSRSLVWHPWSCSEHGCRWCRRGQCLFLHHCQPGPLLFLCKETQLYIDMIKVSPEGSPGALHSNFAVDIFWNVDSVTAKNGLHSCRRCGKDRKADS